jgi:diguanylate cyclase (GGDEF)-like protein
MRGHLERRIAELAEGKPFSVLYVDVDEFKGVNESLGHEVGDNLLCHVADCLRSCVAPQDLVARLGGGTSSQSSRLPQATKASSPRWQNIS